MAPFSALLDRIWWSKGMRAIDLGCGDGHHSQVLHQRLRAARTVGIDASQDAILSAKARQTQTLNFRQADPLNWTPDAPVDLVLINEPRWQVDTLQQLIRHARTCLGPEGQIAIHQPWDMATPLAAPLLELAQEARFEALFKSEREPHPIDSVELSCLLEELGFETQMVEVHTLGHRLTSAERAVQWVMEFALPSMESKISEEAAKAYRSEALRLVADLVGSSSPFFIPSTHLLVWARLP